MKPDYDTTVARIAGNIVPGLISRGTYDGDSQVLVSRAVFLARAIVAEVKRTQPRPTQEPT